MQRLQYVLGSDINVMKARFYDLYFTITILCNLKRAIYQNQYIQLLIKYTLFKD